MATGSGGSSSTFAAAVKVSRRKADIHIAGRSGLARERLLEAYRRGELSESERNKLGITESEGGPTLGEAVERPTLGEAVERERGRITKKYGYESPTPEQQRVNIAKQMIGRQSKVTYVSYPEYKGRLVSELYREKKAKLEAVPGAKRQTLSEAAIRSGATQTPFVRQVLARQKIPYGGAMAGYLTPEAAIQKGLKNIMIRQAKKAGTAAKPEFRGFREATKEVPTRELLKFQAGSQITVEAPKTTYTVDEKKFSRFGDANKYILGLQAKAYREAGVYKRQELLAAEKLKPKEQEIVKMGVVPVTFTSATVTTSSKLKSIREAGFNPDIPIVGSLVEARYGETQIIKEKYRKLINQAKTQSKKEKLRRRRDAEVKRSEMTIVRSVKGEETGRYKPGVEGYMERTMQLDIPFVDVELGNVGRAAAVALPLTLGATIGAPVLKGQTVTTAGAGVRGVASTGFYTTGEFTQKKLIEADQAPLIAAAGGMVVGSMVYGGISSVGRRALPYKTATIAPTVSRRITFTQPSKGGATTIKEAAKLSGKGILKSVGVMDPRKVIKPATKLPTSGIPTRITLKGPLGSQTGFVTKSGATMLTREIGFGKPTGFKVSQNIKSFQVLKTTPKGVQVKGAGVGISKPLKTIVPPSTELQVIGGYTFKFGGKTTKMYGISQAAAASPKTARLSIGGQIRPSPTAKTLFGKGTSVGDPFRVYEVRGQYSVSKTPDVYRVGPKNKLFMRVAKTTRPVGKGITTGTERALVKTKGVTTMKSSLYKEVSKTVDDLYVSQKPPKTPKPIKTMKSSLYKEVSKTVDDLYVSQKPPKTPKPIKLAKVKTPQVLQVTQVKPSQQIMGRVLTEKAALQAAPPIKAAVPSIVLPQIKEVSMGPTPTVQQAPKVIQKSTSPSLFSEVAIDQTQILKSGYVGVEQQGLQLQKSFSREILATKQPKQTLETIQLQKQQQKTVLRQEQKQPSLLTQVDKQLQKQTEIEKQDVKTGEKQLKQLQILPQTPPRSAVVDIWSMPWVFGGLPIFPGGELGGFSIPKPQYFKQKKVKLPGLSAEEFLGIKKKKRKRRKKKK